MNVFLFVFKFNHPQCLSRSLRPCYKQILFNNFKNQNNTIKT